MGKGGIRDKVDKETIQTKKFINFVCLEYISKFEDSQLRFWKKKKKKKVHSHYLALPCPFFFLPFLALHFITLLPIFVTVYWLYENCYDFEKTMILL